mmetsp:Transcript_21320/g.39797  ORF Transcript_21320/g.39797 Transcript_21320/m.39797 type:complete len:1535 (-) Transcript_21320:174-4778(-)
MSDNLLSQSLGGTKKKRTVIVVKKLERRSPKKEVFVSRKIKDGEQLEESFMGNSSAQRPVKSTSNNGQMLNRSILGDPKTFAMYEESIDGDDSGILGPPPSSRQGSRQNNRKTIVASTGTLNENNTKESKRNKKVAMVTDSQNYLDSLKRLKSTAQKLRVKEQEKEANLLQYLPVNERFDLNKEGKVLAMWQERQKKWDQIQRGLSNKVGVGESRLLMSTGDDFRTRNEEYDLLQAAIPVQERFGADSWQMQLRGGTEKAVTIGHIFSGLTCNVSVKRTTPATLRKPKKSRAPPKTTQFIDEFPSMKVRQKQLKKTLQTLRPHNLEIFDVDSLVIGSRDLFDWAIKSSEDYIGELENDVDVESADELSPQVSAREEIDEFAASEIQAENVGPRLNFETTRNLLFDALQTETSKATVCFTNTGTTVMEYTWKKVELNLDSELADSLNERKTIPREHELSEKRPVFFCSNPKGQILPGQSIHTIFLFNSKGCGGYFKEAWMLDTSPRAIVLYPNRLNRAVSMDCPPAKPSDGRASAQPLPSAVYVKLKGHAMTLDEYQHRRDASLNAIRDGCVRAAVSDDVYDSIRNVREPITISELNNRKTALFKSMNSSMIMSNCGSCKDESAIDVSFSRYESFLKLAEQVSKFSEKIGSLEKEKVVEAGINASVSEPICLKDPAALCALRGKLLPEGSISLFDEISEEMLSFSWDLDLSALSEEMERLCVSAANIKEYEKIIQANCALAERKRISAEKRAADSDYESDEEEEEEEDEEEDENAPPKIEHELVVASNAFKAQLLRMFHALSMKSLPSVEEQVRSALCSAVDNYENIRESTIEALEQKGKFEPPQTPNPFSDEGIEFWDDLLVPPTDTAEIAKRQKAGGEKDPKRKYFINVFESVRGSLLDNLSNGLAAADSNMQATVSEAIQQNPAVCDLPSVAALRSSDLENITPSTPVFVGFNGDCFAAEPMKSAFNFTHLEQRLAVTPIIESAVAGAKKVLLVHESDTPMFADSIKAVGKHIQEVLTKEDARLAELRKVVEGKLMTYTVISCASIPEVMHMMQSPPAGEGIVQVYYLDNLTSDKIVPNRREYVEEVSDDDEAPIPVGLDEYREQKHCNWVAEGPQKVVTNITANKKQNKISCYSDAGFAIRELFQESQSVWVEANPQALCATPALSKIEEARVVSSRLRDMSLWIAVMQHMSVASSILSPLLENESAEEEATQFNFSKYFSTLFPPSQTVNPRFTCTIGGNLVPQKMKFLETLIDVAESIILCGELCIPFIACASGVTFKHYTAACSDYKALCGMLLQKAKMRGVDIVLPVDVVTGDEPLSSSQLQLCFANVDDSARDEGADYEGESSVVSLLPGDDGASVFVQGFVYDIGPVTCDTISPMISGSQLHLSWGTAGCTEVSSFQAGQRAIVTAASPPPKPEEATFDATEKEVIPSPHNVVLGESNVEWWARIADPEGEFEGHLTKMGMADFVSINSKSFCSVLSNERSSLSSVIRRPSTSDEWDYLTALRHEDDEEEEEEEEEDDEDDDDEE